MKTRKTRTHRRQLWRDTHAKELAFDRIKMQRVQVVGTALIGFIEEVLGRVPTNDEILAKSYYVHLADTPYSTVEINSESYCAYWVFDHRYVAAYGFHDTKDPLKLSMVRVPQELWPPALCLAIGFHRDGAGKVRRA